MMQHVVQSTTTTLAELFDLTQHVMQSTTTTLADDAACGTVHLNTFKYFFLGLFLHVVHGLPPLKNSELLTGMFAAQTCYFHSTAR